MCYLRVSIFSPFVFQNDNYVKANLVYKEQDTTTHSGTEECCTRCEISLSSLLIHKSLAMACELEFVSLQTYLKWDPQKNFGIKGYT